MKLLLILLFIITINPSKVISQKRNKKQKSEYELKMDTLKIKLSGVKYARLLVNDDTKDVYKQTEGAGVRSADYQVTVGFKEYITEDLGLGFIMTDQQEDLAVNYTTSACDYVYVSYSIGSFIKEFGAVGKYPLEINFIFCDTKDNIFKINVPVNGTTNYRITFRSAFNRIVNKDWKYNLSNRLKIKNNAIVINFNNFSTYLDTCKTLTKYEGVYELFSSNNTIASHLKLGIYNDNGILKVIYLSGANNKDDWMEGELKGTMTKTKSDSDFLLDIYNGFKSLLKGTLTFTNDNAFELKISRQVYTDKYVRLR